MENTTKEKTEKTVVKKETTEERKLTLEERRLRELRNELLEKVEDKLLDEYMYLYMSMIFGYASTLKINFEGLKE